MIRDDDLDRAVAQGIVSPEQAAQLRALAAGADADAPEEAPAPNPDDERFRLIGGFNDVFVTIGIGLLVSGLFALTGAFEIRPGFAVLTIAAAWGLSEFFARRMRLALPSIALAIMLATGAAHGGFIVGNLVSPDFAFVVGGLAVLGAAILHERRFGVPVNWAIGAVALVYACVYAVTLVAPGLAERHWNLMLAIFGIAIFIVALRIDASDVARRTRRSDIAFWLHLVAAPMIVHAVMAGLGGHGNGLAPAQSLAVLLVFAVLGLVAIAIDRRALLVSGLSYAGVALGYLLSEGVNESLTLSLTLLALAGLVLGLSAGWRALRRTLVPALPLGALRSSIPPVT